MEIRNHQRLTLGFLAALIFLGLVFNLPSLGNNLTPRNFVGWALIFLISTYGFFEVFKNRFILFKKNIFWIFIPPLAVFFHQFIVSPSEVNHHYFWLLLSALVGFPLLLLALDQLRYQLSNFWPKLAFFLVIVLATQYFLGEFSRKIGFYDFLRFFLPMEIIKADAGFNQPNLAASFSSAAILWFLSVSSFSRLTYLGRATSIVSVFLVSYFIFDSGSRVGLLGMAVGTLLLTIFFYKEKRAIHEYVYFLVIVVALIFNLFATDGGRLLDTSGDILSGSDVSLMHRLSMYQNSLLTALGNVIFGYGVGEFQWAYHNTFINQSDAHETWAFVSGTDHPHNEILMQFVEMGLYGIIFVITPYLIFGVREIFTSHNKILLVATLFPLLLHSQVENPLHASGFHWLLLGLILVSLGNVDQLTKTALSNSKRLFFIPIQLLSLSVSILSLEAALASSAAWKDYNIALLQPESQKKVELIISSKSLDHWLIGVERKDNAIESIMAYAVDSQNVELIKANIDAMRTVQEKWQTQRQWLIVSQAYLIIGEVQMYKAFMNRVSKLNQKYVDWLSKQYGVSYK